MLLGSIWGPTSITTSAGDERTDVDAMSLSKRICVFCGAPGPLTKEHVTSKWVSDVLARDPRGLRRPITHARRGATKRVWTATKYIDMLAKCVCNNCNEGWMNDAELRARPFLEPIIRGQQTALSREGQTAVAGWSALKSIVGRYAHEPAEPVEQDWLECLHRTHEPPPSWHIWTTRYDGAEPIYYENHDITLTFPGETGRATPHGILATLVIGYLAIKVLGIHAGVPTSPTKELLLYIWLSHDRQLIWPPPRSLTDADLPDFAAMFLR
jgi:hypothetical protein